MSDDAELIRRHVSEGSSEAFAELVQRHLGMVFHAALRQVGGDAHLAQDVAQRVFTDLARKAGGLGERTVLAGWLYTATRLAAAQAVRTERRWRMREAEALSMREHLADGDAAPPWEALRPVIDETLQALGERDREVILLRFFEGQAYADIGKTLAVNEDAARVRTDRALEKLRQMLVRRGVTSTATALGTVLAGQALAAPAGMAAGISGAALAAASTTAATAWMTFMGMTKMQVGLSAVLLAGGVSGVVWQQRLNDAMHRERVRYEREVRPFAEVTVENERLRRLRAEVRELQKDDLELARLAEEAAVLKTKLDSAARVQTVQAARPRPAPPSQPVLALAEVDVRPTAVKRVNPVYPVDLRRTGEDGQAVVRYVVQADGRVANVEVVKATHPAFGEAALEALQKWAFTPAQKTGANVNVKVTMPFNFTAKKKDERIQNWF
jgi:RNA polymerase sigma factor (sigma-70 family)